MAECVFNFACQVPLSWNDTILTINFLKNNCQLIPEVNSTENLIIENHNLFLIMAVLYCFDCSYFENRQNSKILNNLLILLFLNYKNIFFSRV